MPDIKKTKKRAAAIRYEPSIDSVPVLAAFGEGFVAEKIIEKGKEAGIPIMPDAELASMLSRMSIGDEIPPALYEVVAKVLVFVGEVDQRFGAKIRQAAE